MGYLNTAVSLVNTFGDGNIRVPEDRMPRKSVAELASEGTFQFGFLVADSMSIDSAATLARTAERTYASFVQTVIGMNSTIDITASGAIPDYIKKIHQNMKEAAEETSVLPDGSVYVEAVNLNTDAVYSDKYDRFIVSYETADASLNHKIMVDMKNGQRYVFEGFDTTPMPQPKSRVVVEANTLTRTELIKDALKDPSAYTGRDKTSRKDYDNKETIPTLLGDREVKKQNDTQPYLMKVRLTGVNDKNEFVQFVDFIVGVKVNLHLIKSSEMVDNIARAITEKSGFFKFVRWTTGEISFFKDFLLSVGETRNKIAARTDGSNPFWSQTDRIRDRAKTMKKLFSKVQFVPNSTLAITNYEIERIREISGYDMNDPRIARKMIDSLFLMTFIIVDEGSSTVKIMYNYEKSFKVIALETLERETMQSTNRLGKELLRMTVR
nr:MAG TPA: hypothetical protein [Caudoviricetes sp.]